MEKTELPITQMLPTHMSSRGLALLEEGKKWVRKGGYLDFTADTLSTGEIGMPSFNPSLSPELNP